MEKNSKANIIEEVSIDGKPFRLTHENIPIEHVEYDEENPRLKYTLQVNSFNGGKRKFNIG